jgi:hypothetical protein
MIDDIVGPTAPVHGSSLVESVEPLGPGNGAIVELNGRRYNIPRLSDDDVFHLVNAASPGAFYNWFVRGRATAYRLYPV